MAEPKQATDYELARANEVLRSDGYGQYLDILLSHIAWLEQVVLPKEEAKVCPTCGGTGQVPRTDTGNTCPVCHGTGREPI